MVLNGINFKAFHHGEKCKQSSQTRWRHFTCWGNRSVWRWQFKRWEMKISYTFCNKISMVEKFYSVICISLYPSVRCTAFKNILISQPLTDTHLCQTHRQFSNLVYRSSCRITATIISTLKSKIISFPLL